MLDVVLEHALPDNHFGFIGEEEANQVKQVAVALLDRPRRADLVRRGAARIPEHGEHAE